jgi:hypothetical protein
MLAQDIELITQKEAYVPIYVQKESITAQGGFVLNFNGTDSLI